MRAEPNMVTQGPIFESFSNHSTNSLITLKITQESELLISAQSLSLNALRIRCSSSRAFWMRSFSTFFILVILAGFPADLSDEALAKSDLADFRRLFSENLRDLREIFLYDTQCTPKRSESALSSSAN